MIIDIRLTGNNLTTNIVFLFKIESIDCPKILDNTINSDFIAKTKNFSKLLFDKKRSIIYPIPQIYCAI